MENFSGLRPYEEYEELYLKDESKNTTGLVQQDSCGGDKGNMMGVAGIVEETATDKTDENDFALSPVGCPHLGCPHIGCYVSEHSEPHEQTESKKITSCNDSTDYAYLLPDEFRPHEYKENDHDQFLKHAKLETLDKENKIFSIDTNYYKKSIIFALECGDTDQFRWLLEQYNVDHASSVNGVNGVNGVNSIDDINDITGHTLLTLVIMFAAWNLCEKISPEKSQIHCIYNPTKDGITNAIVMAEILLCYHADVNARSGEGKTPLFYACEYELYDFVGLFVQNGADVNKMTAVDDISPITIATAVGNARIVLYLLEHGAIIPVNEKGQNNALRVALLYGKHVIWHILQIHLENKRLTEQLAIYKMQSGVGTTLQSGVATRVQPIAQPFVQQINNSPPEQLMVVNGRDTTGKYIATQRYTKKSAGSRSD